MIFKEAAKQHAIKEETNQHNIILKKKDTSKKRTVWSEGRGLRSRQGTSWRGMWTPGPTQKT